MHQTLGLARWSLKTMANTSRHHKTHQLHVEIAQHWEREEHFTVGVQQISTFGFGCRLAFNCLALSDSCFVFAIINYESFSWNQPKQRRYRSQGQLRMESGMEGERKSLPVNSRQVDTESEYDPHDHHDDPRKRTRTSQFRQSARNSCDARR